MAMCRSATGRESTKSKRDLEPAHYLLDVESFSALSMLDKYDSDVFNAGGCKWRLSLYPKGNKNHNGSGYISLYLSIEEFPPNQTTVHVNYKLFVHDKLHNKYLTMQDADGAISTFDHSKKQHGFPRFLSREEFKKPSSGYLDKKGCCTFGAEVFVIQPAAEKTKGTFALTRYPRINTFTFSIKNWSAIDLYSENFEFEERKWKLLVYPKGDAVGMGKSLSVYLEVQGLPTKTQVYAEFNLRVLDQVERVNIEKPFKCWLSDVSPRGGDANFMPLEDSKKKSAKQFVQDDTLVVEVQISAISNPPPVANPPPPPGAISNPHPPPPPGAMSNPPPSANRPPPPGAISNPPLGVNRPPPPGAISNPPPGANHQG